MTTASDADVNRLYTMVEKLQASVLANQEKQWLAQQDVVSKLIRIETTLEATADLRGRVETLEKAATRRSGQATVIAVIASALMTLVLTVGGYAIKFLIGF